MKVKDSVKEKGKQLPRRPYQEGAFSVQLTTILKRKVISQQELAMELGVSRQCVNNWVNARTNPNFASLCHIADFCGVTTDYLLDR